MLKVLFNTILVACLFLCVQAHAQTTQKNKKADKELSDEDHETASPKFIRLVMQDTYFNRFSYSDTTVLDALNQITYRLQRHGISLKINSKNISYLKKETAQNGATFYFGPLLPPTGSHQYNFNNQIPLIEIIADICKRFDLKYHLKDGIITFVDSPAPFILGMPKNGFYVSTVYNDAKANETSLKRYLKANLKYQGYISAIGRISKNKIFLSINGSNSRLLLDRKNLDNDVYKALKKIISQYKKRSTKDKREGRKKRREAKKTGEKEENISAGFDPKSYIIFNATCQGLDRGRLIFNDATNISLTGINKELIDDSQSYEIYD